MIVVTVARRPLAESTIASNTLSNHAGGLDIDGSRIGTESRILTPGGTGPRVALSPMNGTSSTHVVEGRWPANLILSPPGAEDMDSQSGQSTSTGGTWTRQPNRGLFPLGGDRREDPKDEGGASRFFRKV